MLNLLKRQVKRRKQMRVLPLLMLLLALTWSCNRSPRYSLTPEALLAELQEGGRLITVQEATRLLQDKSDGYTFVDLRTPAAYEMGHLEGAVNIPTANVLDPPFRRMLNGKEGTVFILYGDDELEADGPWLILRQLGYNQVRVMQGGYDYFVHLTDTTLVSPPSLPDQAPVDYAALFQAAVAREQKALDPLPAPKVVSPPKKVTVKPKPAVKKEEEGC